MIIFHFLSFRIVPLPKATIYVNGELITEPLVLHNSNRLILGKNHVFCFINPFEVRKAREAKSAETAAKTKRVRRVKKQVVEATTEESTTDALDHHDESLDEEALMSNEEDEPISYDEEEPEPTVWSPEMFCPVQRFHPLFRRKPDLLLRWTGCPPSKNSWQSSMPPPRSQL